MDGGDSMKRFPRSKAKIQALNICIHQYTMVAGHGELWAILEETDTFGSPIICTVEDIEWAMEYLDERCQMVEVTA